MARSDVLSEPAHGRTARLLEVRRDIVDVMVLASQPQQRLRLSGLVVRIEVRSGGVSMSARDDQQQRRRCDPADRGPGEYSRIFSSDSVVRKLRHDGASRD